MRKEQTTIAPVQAGDFTDATKEFGRDKDVYVRYSIKRGTLYNLHAQGKVRSVLLRVSGRKSGLRLWHMESIRDFIQSQMREQNAETPDGNGANEEGAAR